MTSRAELERQVSLRAADPNTGVDVPFFHPRIHAWSAHFAWEDYEIVGLTPTGRATVTALDLNHSRRVRIRQAEQIFGLFPPGPRLPQSRAHLPGDTIRITQFEDAAR